MKLFDKNMDSTIILEEGAQEAVLLAAYDLQRDLRRISGKKDGFPIERVQGGRGIYIKTEPRGEAEAYTVAVEDEKVILSGADALGTVYGIYAFATVCLGIPPICRMTDLFPEEREEMMLGEKRFSSEARAVRFRGWFLNDEDLLTEFKHSGGKRHIDYPFYGEVMDTAVLDMVLETALRLEINLIIPSSFVDIDNPDEEKLVAAAVKRGLYVSQHHVEPMGVSFFGAENYLKKHGFDGEAVSFLKNRARMEEIWRHYAEKWAKYGENVVWQLGLRGKGDQAVWSADPSIPNSMEARGAIISDAIGTQYDIICRALGHDRFFSTATLWNEGSELYGKKFLKLPKNTVPIFSDLGIDQMFGEDLFAVGQASGMPYGVYYHVGFWWLGPHLAEGCNPEKMAFAYREAAKSGQLCYSILNVSNVRPLHFSAAINAYLLRSPATFDVSRAVAELDRFLFGAHGEAVSALRREYYEAFADFGGDYVKKSAMAHCFCFKEYGALPFTRLAVTDGVLKYAGTFVVLGRNELPDIPADASVLRAALEASVLKWRALLLRADEAGQRLSGAASLYFKQFLRYQIFHMCKLTEWCLACIALTDETLSPKERLAHGKRGCDCLSAILEERKVLEMGQWEHWHEGDKKINIAEMLQVTKKECEKITL